MSNSDSSQQHENRIALTLEYDGANYCGWQRQLSPAVATVQQQVESALSKVANHAVAVICAGRTDSGVHATSQVIHFDCAIDRGRKAWVFGCNSLLPDSIRIVDAKAVGLNFHARFSATARRYNYVIQQRETAPAILSRRVLQVWQNLDVEAMNAAAQALLGEQDFSAFRAAGCQSNSSFRNLSAVQVFSLGSFVVIDIRANAFLQHMVRNIVGALLVVGRGAKPVDWIATLLATKDRTQGAVTAKPDGLYLVGVSYPDNFAISSRYIPPAFIEALG